MILCKKFQVIYFYTYKLFWKGNDMKWVLVKRKHKRGTNKKKLFPTFQVSSKKPYMNC